MKKLKYYIEVDNCVLEGMSKVSIAKQMYASSKVFHFTGEPFEKWIDNTSKRIKIQYGYDLVYEDIAQFIDQLEHYGLIRSVQ
tara:strand:+ start:33232 stop:33480 length:249 start_codon:yes stop_codon:yes gene_type:complete